MGYVEKVLRPGETVLTRARLHWIIYLAPVKYLVAALLFLGLVRLLPDLSSILYVLSAAAGLIAAGSAFLAWFDQWITEIAVTNYRVIYKTGFIWRHTSEMDMEKVESVTVNQSLLGRLLDYGTVHVLGTGEGITHLNRIADPIGLRNAIIAR